MGMVVLLMLRDFICGMVNISVDFTLIFAAVKTDRFAVFLSTSNSPPHPLAMDSRVSVFQESKGSPLTEIHPLKADNLLSITSITI